MVTITDKVVPEELEVAAVVVQITVVIAVAEAVVVVVAEVAEAN